MSAGCPIPALPHGWEYATAQPLGTTSNAQPQCSRAQLQSLSGVQPKDAITSHAADLKVR